ncbi:hypothetical protein GCM10011584_23040 [Nocardioides phosphati]|uniref:Uncharacterized protein n=1 Tax=Nocardioides phosphati TaxID=1867775 RepID=A0ABQ2NBS3_9ACTN|nr:hypothetical protein [Nocardioides phosphati]GGO90683.1 hypothetical protein GCM10011584_23040 [Nocardioides phosphati]
MSAAASLAHQLGAEPPTGLSLSEADTGQLAALIKEARRAQGAELEASLRKALEIVPRPLRGTVRKVVGL